MPQKQRQPDRLRLNTPNSARVSDNARLCNIRYSADPDVRVETAVSHDRVRTDQVDTNGTVTMRHAGKLYHLGIGRTHARTRVLLLIQDLHIRIINAATGELLRELVLNPERSYQPTGKPRGGSRKR